MFHGTVHSGWRRKRDALGSGWPGIGGTIHSQRSERDGRRGHSGAEVLAGYPDGDARQVGKEEWEQVSRALEPLIQIWEVAAECVRGHEIMEGVGVQKEGREENGGQTLGSENLTAM